METIRNTKTRPRCPPRSKGLLCCRTRNLSSCRASTPPRLRSHRSSKMAGAWLSLSASRLARMSPSRPPYACHSKSRLLLGIIATQALWQARLPITWPTYSRSLRLRSAARISSEVLSGKIEPKPIRSSIRGATLPEPWVSQPRLQGKQPRVAYQGKKLSLASKNRKHSAIGARQATQNNAFSASKCLLVLLEEYLFSSYLF